MAHHRRVMNVPSSTRNSPTNPLSPGRPIELIITRTKTAARTGSPDYEYYQAVKKAHDGKLAAIAMARKLARRCYHTLRNLDPEMVYAMPDA